MTKAEARAWVRRIRMACRQAEVGIALSDSERIVEAQREISGGAALLNEYAGKLATRQEEIDR